MTTTPLLEVKGEVMVLRSQLDEAAKYLPNFHHQGLAVNVLNTAVMQADRILSILDRELKMIELPAKNSDSEKDFLLVKSRIQEMLTIQAELNKRVHPNWSQQGYRWRDAMMVEAVELFDHTSWKWWKKNAKIDWDQVFMEAVDIWHFLLSEIMEDNGHLSVHDIAHTASVLESTKREYTDNNAILDFVHVVSDRNQAPLSDVAFMYFRMMFSIGMTFEDLYSRYLGKAKLNEFRWSHDYGGDYVKDWLGVEDNQYLSRLLKELDVSSINFGDLILKGLSDRYAVVTAPKNVNVKTYEDVQSLAA